MAVGTELKLYDPVVGAARPATSRDTAEAGASRHAYQIAGRQSLCGWWRPVTGALHRHILPLEAIFVAWAWSTTGPSGWRGACRLHGRPRRRRPASVPGWLPADGRHLMAFSCRRVTSRRPVGRGATLSAVHRCAVSAPVSSSCICVCHWLPAVCRPLPARVFVCATGYQPCAARYQPVYLCVPPVTSRVPPAASQLRSPRLRTAYISLTVCRHGLTPCAGPRCRDTSVGILAGTERTGVQGHVAFRSSPGTATPVEVSP